MRFRDLISIDESLAQDRIHENPPIATIKNLARNNRYGSVRFVIYKDGSFRVGDSEKFTHQDIAPAMGAWYLRGYVDHLAGDDYAYRSIEPYSNLTKYHPLLKKFERMGIADGNDQRLAHATAESSLGMRATEFIAEDPMTFYHGSMDELPVGTTLKPRDDYEQRWSSTDFYAALERYRPANMLPHERAVFMVGDPDDVDLAGGGTEWLFTVKPLGPIQKHDLNWGSEISMLISDGHSIDSPEVKRAADNYWAGLPHQDESVWEYLTPAADIIAVEPY